MRKTKHLQLILLYCVSVGFLVMAQGCFFSKRHARECQKDVAGEVEEGRDIDVVILGKQVWGEPLIPEDLEDRIVVCYHWELTCGRATGAFPKIKKLADKFRDQGVIFIGFHVCRHPEIVEENIIYRCQQLQPNFPITRRGWVSEWPAYILPWAIVFDHTGKRIFGDRLWGMETVIEEAVAKAPHYLVGGPYKELKDLADKIAVDQKNIGPYLKKLRAIIAKEKADSTKTQEAEKLLGCLRAYFDRRLNKVYLDPSNKAYSAEIYSELAAVFQGDELGDEAEALLRDLEQTCDLDREREAERAFRMAKTEFRKLPPKGNYAYDLSYKLTDDEIILARRAWITVKFKHKLRNILKKYPGTNTAEKIEYLLLLDEGIPTLSVEWLRENLELAQNLVNKASTLCELYDAFLISEEIAEDYNEDDEFARQAGDLLEQLKKEKLPELGMAEEEYTRLNRTAEKIAREVELGGSLLPKEDADRFIKRLDRICAEAGPGSYLAWEFSIFSANLKDSYQGYPMLGIYPDRNYEGSGVRIRWIFPNTAASKYNLQIKDVIVQINGAPIYDMEDFQEKILKYKPCQKISFVIRRGGEEAGVEKSVEIILGRKVR
ncbi:PDZ domain-containing protein [Planctomycetota bacterium]